jgi:hypothetical protein
VLRNRLRATRYLLAAAVLVPTLTAPAAHAASAAPLAQAPHSAVTSAALTSTALTSANAMASAARAKGTKSKSKGTKTPASRTEQEPTSAELQQQHAQVARLKAEAAREAAGVDDAQQALEGAAVLAGQALEDYATAVRQLQTRQLVEQQREDALALAQATLDDHRRDLGRWAREVYSNGSGLGGYPALTSLLAADSSSDAITNLTTLHRLGQARADAVTEVQATTRKADQASDAAAAASENAAAAAVRSASAKQAADDAVNQQRRLLGVAESSLADTQDDVSAAAAREAGLRAALLAASGPTPTSGSGASKDNRVTGTVGSCVGGDVQQYPNGQIPTAALCALRASPGHYLRADAAYAFDRMSAAYAVRFGRTICVTDSYRSYAAQVSVYARKPGLAAVPGTSNHGWGTAVDLCGGIQSFTSTEHRWMTVNAPLYGWFHPGWAQQTGSKPEPWHWEFGG